MADKKDPKKDADKDSDEQSPLTEEQRIALLEKAASTNKFVLLAFAFFLIIFVSVATTAFAIFVVKGNEAEAPKQAEAAATVHADIEKQYQKLEAIDAKLVEHSLSLERLQKQLNNSGNLALAQVLNEQEQNFQTFLTSLRAATYDLAHMVPGSRAWLEMYSSQIDSAVDQSKQRQRKIERIKSSEAEKNTSQESTKENSQDPFFGEEM